MKTIFNIISNFTTMRSLNINHRGGWVLACLVILFSLAVGNAWASTTYYANLTISKSGETGKGKVYYATSNSKPSSETTGALKSAGSTTQNANQTYYWWVDVDPGYNVRVSGNNITAGPATSATLSGNVGLAQGSSSGNGTSYTATANIVAVTVNSVSPTPIALDPTDPSADYPFTVTFPTSNLKTIDIDLNKSPETATVGKFKDIAWSLDGSNVKVTGKFNGGGSYGGASRNNSTTVSLQSKAADSPTRTRAITANFPALEFVSAEAIEVFATQGESGKTGSATFTYNYGADDDFPTTPTIVHTSGSGAFAVTGYTVTPNFSTGVTTVTVNYEFNTNNGVGETIEQLKLTAANGLEKTVTITGHSEALATDDAKVTAADGETLIYQGDWATAWTRANTAANAGCTLQVLRNVTGGSLNANQKVTNTFTLDLNGKILSANYNGSIIYLNTAGKTLTIKDSKTGGRIENVNNAYAGAAYVCNIEKGNLIFESGTLYCENKGASGRRAVGIYNQAGTTVTMNGGKIEVHGYNNSQGVLQTSNKNNNTSFTMNGGEIEVDGYQDIYGVSAPGKVNINDGTINVTATYSNCRGITLSAAASATAANCYWGTLTMKGGTINSTCTADADGNRYAYGIFFDCSNAAMGTAVATDGSHGNKAASTGTIENATINVSTLGRSAFGIRAYGSYQSKTDHYDVIQIKNTKIDVTSKYYYTYGVYADCGINGTCGAIYAANIELTNCDVTATTTKNHTAYCLWATTTATTIYKNAQPNYYGEYAGGATITVNSGTYTANTGTTTAYAIGTNKRAKSTYDSESSTERKLGGNAEAVAILNIHGGKFIANAGTTTARAVSNGGNCTIDGGEFYATTGTTTADGIYTVSGKLKASGVKIVVNAGTKTAYGVRVDAANVPTGNEAWTGFNCAGDAELNNLDVTVSTGTADGAYGVYVNAVQYQYLQSSFDTYFSGLVTKGSITQATMDIYESIFPGDKTCFAAAGKVVVNGGTYKVTAATTTAHGIYSVNRAVAADKVTTAATEMTVKNATLDVKTNGTTTACGILTGGLSTIDGANITVNTKTTTCYGMIISDVEPTTVTNTKIDAKGTTTVYGIYVNSTATTTNGFDIHGNAVLGAGNDVTAAATSGNTAYAVYLHSTKAAVTTGDFAGDYANAGEALITGGTYKATATGTTAYGICLNAQTQQGSEFGRPKCTVEDGKFWGKATGGTDGAVNASGQIGYFTLAGGYYNVNTNLAKYKAEGKNILDVESGTPEYTEGYRFKITSELSGATVCKVYQGTTLKQSYATLEEALQFVNANTGTAYTIVMVADYTLPKGDYKLPSNATLVIPNDVTRKQAMGTKPTREAVSTPVPVQLIMLTFDNGVNMAVSGTIETSAVNTAANGGSAITGAPTGNYGRLHLVAGSTITLESGANLNCWGYTTGKGEINALKGSTVREGFQLGYWRGGTATSSMLSNRNSWHAFPVTDYFIQNVEAPITFRPGAQLLGYSGVNVSIVGIQAANDVKLVGTSASMFLMEEADASEDTYVRKEYDPATDRSIWTVNSGAKIGSFSFSLAGNTVNSADYYLPISNNMTIYVNEGEFTVTQDVLQIPGSIINISKLGKLTVSPGKKLFVMDNEDWPGFIKSGTETVTRWYYNATYSPSWTTNPRTLAYPPATTRLPDAEIFVHGETEGSYYTSTSGANIHSTNEDAGKVKFIAAAGGNTSIQHVVNTDNERKTINFTTAQLKNELESPNEYTSSVGTVAGEAFIYMEKQWVKVLDGCLTTRTDGSGTHYYAKPSDAVEVVENGDNAYRDVATGARYFINAEKPLTNDECVWWEVEPVTSGTYAGDYMANQPKYDNYGAYYYYDATSGYWKPRYVTVTWKNQDGSTLATYTNVLCNTSPKYLSGSPTWANTATEKHDWIGWRDAEGNIYDKNATLPLVQSNITYTAYYNTSKFQYTITFKNPDKTTIWSGLMEAGTIPVCPVAPTQASTVYTDYTFTNWSGYAAGANLPEVTAAATYTAQYSESVRKYTVTFLNYNAVDVLYSAEVAYNTRPVYPDDAVRPFRANTSAYSYNWTGWQQGTTTYGTSETLPVVKGDISYIATFGQTELKYQVLFKRPDGSVIDAPFFSYNEKPSAFPADPTMESTVSTVYTFTGWDPATLVPVTEDGKVYIALFDESVRQYTAHFVNYDGTSLNVDQTIDYNAVPAYTGVTPFKPNDTRNSYEFSGWAWEAGANWEAGSIGLGESFPAIKGDITFTAQFNPVLLQFNVIYRREDGTVIKLDKVKWGQTTTAPYGAECNYEDAMYKYTFIAWLPADIVNPVTTDAIYTALYTAGPKTVGDPLDIIDWTRTGTSGGTVRINLNGFPAGGWPYEINGTKYYQNKTKADEAGPNNKYRPDDRTLTISYTGDPDGLFAIVVKKEANNEIYSSHTYTIPHINNFTKVNENSIVYVNSGTVTVSENTTVNAVYVAPGAELKIAEGATLKAQKLVLRTSEWKAASLDNEGSIDNATKVYYTRQVSDMDYHQFALPLSTTISEVFLSSGASCPYGKTWLLKYYDEESRAINGTTGESNWKVFEGNSTDASAGYELYSGSTFYREFYFPVNLADATGKTVTVSHHDGAAGKAHAGWNALCSPLLSRYVQDFGPDPDEAIKVSVLQEDNRYWQYSPEIIYPAVPFYYQAPQTGVLHFDDKMTIANNAPRRAWNTSVPTQWLQLTIQNQDGLQLDQASIYTHPEKFVVDYESGYDVMKQSLEGGKALLYSELPCGKLAFAAVPDSLAETRIPLTVYAAAEGEYIFSMIENDYLGRLQYVLLHDTQTGLVTDLLLSDFAANLTQGTNAGRFYLQCVFAAEAPEVSTGVNHIKSENEQAQKIIYNNKVYIIYRGRVYDMTGRQCELK